MVASGAGEPDGGNVADQLIVEFGDRVDTETIRLVAEQELASFDRAKVRTFVSVIALRLARARLEELEHAASDPASARATIVRSR